MKQLLTIILMLTISLFASNGEFNKAYETLDVNGTAIVTGLDKTTNVKLLNPITGQTATYSVGTFKGTLDGSPINFYCIDLGHSLVYNQNYIDDGNTGQEITYILNNYYPYKNHPYNGSLADVRQEAAAVQLANWHFSDGLDIATVENAVIAARAQQIIDDANNNSLGSTPVKTLDIVPLNQTLVYGTTAEFVVEAYDETNSPAAGIQIVVTTSSDGVLSEDTVVTDANGKSPVLTLTHANDDYAQVTAYANVIIPQGTRFVHQGSPNMYQQLVLATPQLGQRAVTAEINWEPEIDLSITKTVSDETPDDGDIIDFMITVINNSIYDATNVIVSDMLPLGLDYVSSVPNGEYDVNTGYWNAGTVSANSSKTLTISVQVDYAALNAIPYTLGAAEGFNVFALRDIDQPSADTEGKMAGGRNISLANYSVGDKLPVSNGTVDVLIAGRKITFVSGKVTGGNVVYRRFKDFDDNKVSIVDGTIRKDSLINFAEAGRYLRELSNTLSAYSVNGSTTFEFNGLTLNGDDPFLNVFSVDGNHLTDANNVTINVPNGAVVLINVNRLNISWSGGLHVNGTDISNVLFNFHKAKNITIQNIDVTGTILAPKASVNFVSGVQNGQMIAKDVYGTGQFNNVMFNGNIPVDPAIGNSAEIVSFDQFDSDSTNNDAVAFINISVIPNPNNGGGNNFNWQALGTVQFNELIWTMVNGPAGALYAGTWHGSVYVTANGVDFTKLNEGTNFGGIWDIAISSTQVIYVASMTGLYYSPDLGVTWASLGLTGMDVRTVVVDPNDADVIYAGTWTGGVYKSVDGGANWTQFNSGLNYLVVQTLTIDGNGVIYAGTFGDGIYRFNSNLSAWEKVGAGYYHIWDLAVDQNNKVFAATYGNGVFASEDGLNWIPLNTGLNGEFIYNIRVSSTNNVYVTTWMNGIYVLTNNGSRVSGVWQNAGLNGIGISSVIRDEQTGNFYAAADDGTIYFAENPITDINDNKIEVLDYNLNQNYPNPFNPSTLIKFSVKDVGVFSLKVFNIIGQEVAELVNGQLTSGNYEVNFDASDLSSGVYIYSLKGDNVNLSKKMILIK